MARVRTARTGKPLFESYPLRWPEGHPRKVHSERRKGQFSVSLATARDELVDELKLLGAVDVIVSSDVPTRRDGLPYALVREPDDPGVAVYFERRGQQYVFACDTFTRFVQNLRAVGLTIAAPRAIQRYGASEMLERAFTGFAALPAARAQKPWWEVLGVSRTASRSAISAAHRELALIHHPDRGGNAARMSEINAARDEALQACATNGVS